MALTLADVWNIATDGRAVIIGQGGAIRATAGLVGHGACRGQRAPGVRGQLRGARGRRLGDESHVLLDVAGAEAAECRALLEGSGRHLDGPRHRHRRALPRIQPLSTLRRRRAGGSARRAAARRR